MAIGNYSIVAINDYFINDYQWLLVVILLVATGGYYIGGYFLLF